MASSRSKSPPGMDSRSSFLKRKETLKKKARELATLCGITVCMVCFGPNGEVVTWPENHAEVRDVIMKYKGDNSKKHNFNPSIFLEAKGEKLKEKKDKPLREKLEGIKLDELSENSLMQLWDFCESNLKVVNERLELQKERKNQGDTSRTVSCGDIVQNTQYPPGFYGLYGTIDNNLGVYHYNALMNGNGQIGFAISPWGYHADMANGFALMGSGQNPGSVVGNQSFPMGFIAGNSVGSSSGSEVVESNEVAGNGAMVPHQELVPQFVWPIIMAGPHQMNQFMKNGK